MDTKNIIAAISLSAAVIILYSLFFAPSPQERKQIHSEKNKASQNVSGDAPSLDQNNETITTTNGEKTISLREVKTFRIFLFEPTPTLLLELGIFKTCPFFS